MLRLPRSRSPSRLHRMTLWMILLLIVLLSDLQILILSAPVVAVAVAAVVEAATVSSSISSSQTTITTTTTVSAVLNALFSSSQSNPRNRNRNPTSSLRWLQEDTSNGNGNGNANAKDDQYGGDEYYYYYYYGDDDYAGTGTGTASASACADELDAVNVCMTAAFATNVSEPAENNKSNSTTFTLTPEQVALNAVAVACDECILNAHAEAYHQFQQDLQNLTDPLSLTSEMTHNHMIMDCAYGHQLACLPIRTCTCLAPCAAPFTALYDCEFQFVWQKIVHDNHEDEDWINTDPNASTTTAILPEECASLVCEESAVNTEDGDDDVDNNNNGGDSSSSNSNSNSGSTTETDNSGSESSDAAATAAAAAAAGNSIMVIARLLFLSGTAAALGGL